MGLSTRALAAVVVAIAFALTPAAGASTITYSFTVTATSGPLSGTVANGTFSYDSSVILPGLTNVAIGSLNGLDFTWNGIHYDQTTANTGALSFDASGNLLLMLFGTHCTPALCQAPPGVNSWDIAGFNGFNYSLPTAGSGVGTVTRSLVTPEPSSLALGLIGVGLLALGLPRRARAAARIRR